MKILFLAYASEPGAGSEYGVGWMVPLTMAERYPEQEIYVLTRSRCREKIVQSLKGEVRKEDNRIVDSMEYKNLHYVFFDIPNWMTYPNEMKSKWGEQINYLLWQVKVRRFVKKLHHLVDFDVVHHLTFNQYRTPSPGFWLDIPFVMGPIGGAETISPSFFPDLDPHTAHKEEIRQKGKDLKLFGWLMKRSRNKKMILCSCEENLKRLKPYVGDNLIRIMPAIAFSKQDFEIEKQEGKVARFTMLYAGKAWDWKGIRIFLRAAKKAFLDQGITDFSIKLVGIRFEDEQKRVKGWIEECGLDNQVELIPFIQRSELLKMECTISLSVYPAFRDSGSMSVLEASALACPTICFEAGGQDIFPDDILIKVPVGETYDENLEAFASRLRWAYDYPDEARELGLRSQVWVNENLTWNKKVDEFMNIYKICV